jgi:hypothetical protein
MKASALLIILIWPVCLYSQQIADTSYNPVIPVPAYGPGNGPVVFIDEGHHNFHTREGRYKAFATLLERDGYVVSSYNGPFERTKLEDGKILVISNALNETNVEDWYLPTPSAFTKTEIKVVKKWVKQGGSLFLIADHMPMAGAAKDLAASFGFSFTNGFVFHMEIRGPALFNMEEGSLVESIITKGRDSTENIRQIATFTGQGFKIPGNATPILVFDEHYENILPDTAWVFDEETTRFSIPGWSQGAFKEYGRGRVVLFGEAAMFSAQLAGPEKIKAGMNTEIAAENYKLLLNIIHWLDGILNDP